DDWEQYVYSAKPQMGYSIEEPDKAYRLWKAEFDGLYEKGGCFVITMHPQLSGRASRIKVLEDLICYMKTKPGVWFTTLDEIEEKWSKGKISVEHSSFPNVKHFFS